MMMVGTREYMSKRKRSAERVLVLALRRAFPNFLYFGSSNEATLLVFSSFATTVLVSSIILGIYRGSQLVRSNCHALSLIHMHENTMKTLSIIDN